MITPEQLAKPNTEDAHQAALFCWAAQELFSGRHPELRWMHAIPNGGARDGITAGKLKATGVRAGVWDISLPVGRHGFSGAYIELKKPGREKDKNGGLSTEQLEFRKFVDKENHFTYVAYSWMQARDILKWYLGALNNAGCDTAA